MIESPFCTILKDDGEGYNDNNDGVIYSEADEERPDSEDEDDEYDGGDDEPYSDDDDSARDTVSSREDRDDSPKMRTYVLSDRMTRMRVRTSI